MSDELLFIFYCCNMLFNMWLSSTGDAFIRFFLVSLNTVTLFMRSHCLSLRWDLTWFLCLVIIRLKNIHLTPSATFFQQYKYVYLCGKDALMLQ